MKYDRKFVRTDRTPSLASCRYALETYSLYCLSHRRSWLFVTFVNSASLFMSIHLVAPVESTRRSCPCGPPACIILLVFTLYMYLIRALLIHHPLPYHFSLSLLYIRRIAQERFPPPYPSHVTWLLCSTVLFIASCFV